MSMDDPMMGNEPPMGNEQMQPMDCGMGQDPMMGNESPMDDEMGEGDAATDPKKSIQQLSGKLSQELRNYNQEQQTPDTDLNKYVAGMVIPQATKAMTDDDKKEVINKINKGLTDDEMNEPMDDESGMEQPQGDMPMESRFSLDNIINEIIGSIVNGDDNKNREEKDITNKKVTNKNPFVSNR